jgi:hypothetical protein
MPSFCRYCLIFLAAVLLLGGCYNNPVRNLASDVLLIKAGQSTGDDVLTYLGEPDEQKVIDKGVEQWLFREKTSTVMERTPVVGKYLGSPGIGQVIVTVKDNVVVDSRYEAHDADENDWTDDFSWQKGKK